jgi:hypothetical protein
LLPRGALKARIAGAFMVSLSALYATFTADAA